MDLKYIGVSPRRFESCRLRSHWLFLAWNAYFTFVPGGHCLPLCYSSFVFSARFLNLIPCSVVLSTNWPDLFHQSIAKGPVMVTYIHKRSCLFLIFTPSIGFKFLSCQQLLFWVYVTEKTFKRAHVHWHKTKPSRTTLIIGPWNNEVACSLRLKCFVSL